MSVIGLQVRYYVRSMNGVFKLPTPAQMVDSWEEEKLDRAARGYTKRQAHMMGPDQVIHVVHHISWSTRSQHCGPGEGMVESQ